MAGAPCYEGTKLLIDNGHANADRDTASKFVDSTTDQLKVTKSEAVFSQSQSWRDIRTAFIYAVGNTALNVTTVTPNDKPAPAGTKATFRDQVNTAVTCANEWIYAKPAKDSKIDCVTAVAKDLGIHQTDATNAFNSIDPMQAQVGGAFVRPNGAQFWSRCNSVAEVSASELTARTGRFSAPQYVGAGFYARAATQRSSRGFDRCR